MPDTLPIRRLVLYKHGVGYVTRQGTAGGDELELPFRDTEVDDALKSLVAFTLDGGQVTGIHYQTPENKAERLGEIPLSLGDRHSLFDLLRAARGVPATLKLEGGKSAQGRVVGVERHPQGRKGSAMVILMTGEGSVEQIASDRVTQIQIEDERMAQDLSHFLDASRSEESRRTVRIALSEAGRQVQVSYTIPSPVWRVSYRLVGSGSGREALLQGWGIFDNRLEEDLEEVEVALVAGQPVSFRYDLTSSVIPERRLVRDEARIAAEPVEFEGVYAPVAAAAAPAGAAEFRASFHAARAMTSRPVDVQPADLAASTLQTADGRELEELFEYRVGGVSVRRGESAMIPIAQHTSGYRRELLYNGQKHPRHPVASLRLRNRTGLTLERGPITIVEDGQYRGEAILPFTKPDGEIVLAYAVELGITVTEEMQETHNTFGLHLEGAFIHIQEHIDRRTTYTLTNSTSEEQVVTIERLKWTGAELADTRSPDEETAEHRRWRVTCPARAMTAFDVTERFLLRRHVSIMDESLTSLSDFLEHRFLDRDTRHALEDILRLRQTIHDLDLRLEKLRAEQEGLGSRQARLRENLTIQPASEQEQEIRRHSAEEFRRTQDREEQILAEMEQLQRERQQAEENLKNALTPGGRPQGEPPRPLRGTPPTPARGRGEMKSGEEPT